MNSPYTAQPLDALLAAQTAVGCVLGAIVVHQRIRPRAAALALLLAIACAVLAPVDGDFWRGIGLHLGPAHFKHVLEMGLLFATAGVLLTRRPGAAIVMVLLDMLLWGLTEHATKSDNWVAAVNLGALGAVVGLFWKAHAGPKVTRAPSNDRLWIDDLAFFVIGTAMAAVVSIVLLHRWTNSGDEWADTYQAAVFAKLHAYGAVPPCSEAFRAFWVFQFNGRSFAQYTPGWPLFMTPFMWISAPWLAGPASLGVLAAAVCRLGRRAAGAGFVDPATPNLSEIRASGRFAASAVLLGATMLINGASRYPHVFTAAAFAWSVEALCVICWADGRDRRQGAWGAVLGLSAAMLLATRPGDGATLGLGLAVYFVYALARRRVRVRSVVAAVAAFAALAALTLVILRLQLGRWLETGYSLSGSLYAWAAPKFSVPKPDEWHFGVPLDTGSYCWWPCSPAVGIAGLMLLRGRSRGLGVIFGVSYAALFAFYTLSEFGRGWDIGYGPRFILSAVVPMAVGTGVALGRLWTAARTRASTLPAWRGGGPLAVALTVAVIGIVRIAPLVYPITYADVQNHNRLHAALEQANLHDAIVLGGVGLTNTDPKDLPENLPFELYPDQDVLIANDTGPEVVQCIRERFPERRLYRANPGNPVSIVPY